MIMEANAQGRYTKAEIDQALRAGREALRRYRKRSALRRTGTPCHVPGCGERFANLSGWERHAAATGHDARRGQQRNSEATPPAIEYAVAFHSKR